MQETALRKSALQRACFILVPRAQGLDRLPMSGFANAEVDAESFPRGCYRRKFLLSIRYGERTSFRPRPAQLGSAEAAAGL
jgi:3-hydroxypropanoate dehydrogenase